MRYITPQITEKKFTEKNVKHLGILRLSLLVLISFLNVNLTIAQKSTLKQDVLNSLQNKSFDEFVVEMNSFLERAPDFLANEVKKQGMICNEDNYSNETKFIDENFTNKTYKSSELKKHATAYLKSISFQQTFGPSSSVIKLIPDTELKNKLRVYVRTGLELKTVIYKITYADGSVSEDEVAVSTTTINIPSEKEITEIKAKLSLTYPIVKTYRIKENYKKITEGGESIEIRFKGNKVQVLTPKSNFEYLTVDTTQQIDAVHSSKKILEDVSTGTHKSLDTESLNKLRKTIEALEAIFRKVNEKEITTTQELIKVINVLPDAYLASNYNRNSCYYGDVAEVLFYYNTQNDQNITETLNIKPKKRD